MEYEFPNDGLGSLEKEALIVNYSQVGRRGRKSINTSKIKVKTKKPRAKKKTSTGLGGTTNRRKKTSTGLGGTTKKRPIAKKKTSTGLIISNQK